jgi:hypothetical protein
VVGFPNLFTITGPGSPSVLTNMLPSIEQHVDWIADCLVALRAKDVKVIEPVDTAEAFWAGEVGGAANITLRSSCSSWYVGANIPGKPRVFMPYIGGLPAYIERCEAVVAKGLRGLRARLNETPPSAGSTSISAGGRHHGPHHQADPSLQSAFAGEVSGVDLRRPLSRADADAIDAGMNRYGVLVFHDQDITDAQQIAFSTTLGPLEVKSRPGTIRKRAESRLGDGMGDLSNLNKDGTIISADDRQWFFKLGDRLWHSDSSYAEVPAKYSLLSGRIVPSWGGNTEFADMRAAYDALDARTRAEVEDLICEHSLLHSRGAIGFTEFTPEEIEGFRPVRQRWCAPIPTPAASRCSCRAMPARSSAGRSPRRARSCAT